MDNNHTTSGVNDLMRTLDDQCGGNGNRDSYDGELPHETRARLLREMDESPGDMSTVIMDENSPPPPKLEDGTSDDIDYTKVKRYVPELYSPTGEKIQKGGGVRIDKNDVPDFVSNPDLMPDLEPGQSALAIKKEQKPRPRRQRVNGKKTPKERAQDRRAQDSVATEKVFVQNPSVTQVVVEKVVEPTHPLMQELNKTTSDKLSSCDPVQLQRICRGIDWVVDLATRSKLENVSLTFPGMGTLKFPLVQHEVGPDGITLCLSMEEMQIVPEVGAVLKLLVPSLGVDPLAVVYSGGNISLEGLGVVFMSFVRYHEPAQ